MNYFKISLLDEAKENINPHPSLSKHTPSLSPVKGVLIDITHKINAFTRSEECIEQAEELLEDHESNFLQASAWWMLSTGPLINFSWCRTTGLLIILRSMKTK